MASSPTHPEDDSDPAAAPSPVTASDDTAPDDTAPGETAADETAADEAASDEAASFAARLLDRAERDPRYRLTRRLLHRYQGWGPPVFFLGGVSWDALTLRRIDAAFDNALLLVYLLALGVCIAWAALDRRDALPSFSSDRLQGLRPWVRPGIQFFAGALFSAYVVFYTQSASWTASSLFLLVLVGLLVANEFLWSRLFNLYVLLGVYTLAACSYFIFFVPVVTGTLGYGTFLGSLACTAGLVGGLVEVLRRRGAFASVRSLAGAAGLVLALLGTVNLFYLQNWIPPVPLALRAGGVYHDVAQEDDAYVLTYESAPWYAVWDRADDTFHYAPGDTVYCFAAIFAPAELQTRVRHHWQRYSPEREAWQTTDRIGYRVVGGRRGGYRGYTFKRRVTPGRWRVNVETSGGTVIGRVDFRVVPADTTQTLPLRTRRYR